MKCICEFVNENCIYTEDKTNDMKAKNTTHEE